MAADLRRRDFLKGFAGLFVSIVSNAFFSQERPGPEKISRIRRTTG